MTERTIPIVDVIAFHEEQAAHWAKLYAEAAPTTEAVEIQRDRFGARWHEHTRSAEHFRVIAEKP